jgi:hypothetical protein
MASSLTKSHKKPSPTSAAGVNYSAPDLTRHPPRSPRTRIGGYAHLARLLDKARAVAAGKGGDFHYNCPFDVQFFSFTGIDHEAFMAEVKKGKSDTEMLAYVESLSPRKPFEIASWSANLEKWVPTVPDTRAFFNDVHRKNAPQRADIGTWFEWLELDDFVTYGGRP